jgi:hypothetical protein
MRPIFRAVITAGLVTVAGTGGAIAYAAVAGSPASIRTAATACTDSRGMLRLTSGRTCPKGDVPFTVAAAPTPVDVVSASATHSKTVRVGAFTYVAKCRDDEGGTNALLTFSAAGAYVVQGTDVFVDGGGGIFGDGHDSSTGGAGQISFAVARNAGPANLNVANNGGATGDVQIVQAGHSMTVAFALFAFNGSCSVQAQIAPSR